MTQKLEEPKSQLDGCRVFRVSSRRDTVRGRRSNHCSQTTTDNEAGQKDIQSTACNYPTFQRKKSKELSFDWMWRTGCQLDFET